VLPVDASTKGALVSVEDEVPYRDGVVGEARADLAPVLKVVGPGQPWRNVHECLADLLGVERT
jgi:hypothetical protein